MLEEGKCVLLSSFFLNNFIQWVAFGLQREEITTEFNTDTKKKRNPQVWH